MTQEELIGSGLVLRRPSRVSAHTIAALMLAAGAWVLTFTITGLGASAPSRRWWLLAGLLLALVALGFSVLAVRAATSKVVLSRSRISVVSLTGRRSAPWLDVVAVQTGRPYLGLLGSMPVVKLVDSRAIALDALASRLPAGADHPDRARIAQYLTQPGLPAVPPANVVAQPAGPAAGGELIIRPGKLATTPNAAIPALRLLSGRLLVPALTALFGGSVLVLLTQVFIANWFGTAEAAGAVLVFGLTAYCLVRTVARPAILTTGSYRNESLSGGVDIQWPPVQLWVDEGVNLWGTRFVGHLVADTGGGAPPLHLWETSRLSTEAFALKRVAETY